MKAGAGTMTEPKYTEQAALAEFDAEVGDD